MITRKIFKIFGGDRYRDTPVTIPNTEVKSIPPMILAWRRVGKAGAAKLNKAHETHGPYFLLLIFILFYLKIRF